VGKLTHEDYNTITPLIDSALDGVKDPKVKVFGIVLNDYLENRHFV
jgi:hypothetical protein